MTFKRTNGACWLSNHVLMSRYCCNCLLGDFKQVIAIRSSFGNPKFVVAIRRPRAFKDDEVSELVQGLEKSSVRASRKRSRVQLRDPVVLVVVPAGFVVEQRYPVPTARSLIPWVVTGREESRRFKKRGRPEFTSKLDHNEGKARYRGCERSRQRGSH